ncbi:MAG: hypothetical protein GOVbin3205_64 [Prokaryotic dsDNA virus sp.]|nr:MAG: hypothetical protein GOVbin3205_64 [Prokaryotic dsDNA virus sp.]
MSCNSIKDPYKKSKCMEAQRLLDKHVATEALGGKGNNTKKVTMHYGHGKTRDSITFNDKTVNRVLKNK